MFSLLKGKTIEKVEEDPDAFDRTWVDITFTDGTTLHILPLDDQLYLSLVDPNKEVAFVQGEKRIFKERR